MPTITRYIFILLLFGIPGRLKAQVDHHNYYLSPSGNDNNDGHTPEQAWKSLNKINSIDLKPGSHVLLEGGKIFKGAIRLDQNDSGTPTDRVIISSYGNGDAIVNAGDSTGLYGIDCSNIVISSINFKGSGVKKNSGSGIFFYSDLQTHQPENISILRCVADSFGKYGILFGSAEGALIKGYNNVKLDGCRATYNGEAGIGSYGDQTHFTHTNFLINRCNAFHNRGILTKTENHSGNGIVFGSVENIIIQDCKAFENGADNRCNAGGPVGIWVWLCKNATIQHCESYNNHAGAGKDGGGFDIDGGSSNCVLQFNFSHDNEGAGYLLAEYGAALPFINDTIRFNISENDGRKNSYGGITIWGASKQYQVKNSIVYNNTIYVNDKNIVNGTPCAVQVMGSNLSGVILANNIFLTMGHAEFVNSPDPVDSAKIKFMFNNYFSYSSQPTYIWNRLVYHSLSDWKLNANGQETHRGLQTGSYENPQLAYTGPDNQIHQWGSGQKNLINVFPSKLSPIKNSGISLDSLGVTGASMDYYHTNIDNNSRITPGASK